MKKLQMHAIPIVIALLMMLAIAAPPMAAQQMTDVAVTEILLPPAQVNVGTPVGVRFTIENLGQNPAQDFFCAVQISSASAPTVPIFQEQITVEALAAGGVQTLQTNGTWPADPAGDYIVTVAAAFELDNAPTNNLRQQDLKVVSQSNLLTLADAIDILNESVLDNHPRVDSLVALHLSPPANPSDSLIPPGLLIESADSLVILQYDYPVYFFFVDLHPELLFAHPVEYVAISAIDGTIDRTTEVEMWPEIDGVTPDFGSNCFGDVNNRRVRGGTQNCVAKENRYQPVATGNTNAWAVAVVGKLNKKVEKTTVDHDLCRWKERINARGPKVTGPNISGSTGKDGCGMTEQELCDAIDALKGKECDKVFFKYIGHGKQSGIFVWDNEHKRTKKITWREFARKLKAVGVGEVCIEVTACHSGAIIDALKKEGLKGSVITSSSSGRTTPVGEGDGTHWEKALEQCSKEEQADLDRNGTIDQCELFAWVRTMGGPKANGPNPQIFKLNDSVRVRSIRLVRVGSGSTISTNNGSIKVRAERICLRRTINGKDSVLYRGGVYLVNEGRTRRTADRSYDLVGRCGGKDTVLARVRPSLGPGEKVCVADLPNNCTRVRAQRVRNSTEKEDDPVATAAAPDDGYEAIFESVTTEPGAFTYLRNPIVSDVDDQTFVATATGPDGWNVTVHPSNFMMPANDTADFFLGVNVPAGATAGGQVIATIINPAANDTLDLVYGLHLLDTLRNDTLDTWQASWRWYDVLGESFVSGDGLDMRDVVFQVTDTLRILTPQTFDLQRSVITAGPNGVVSFAENPALISTEMRDVGFYGLQDGLHITGGVVDIGTMAIVESRGRGLTIQGLGNLRIDTLRGVSILGTGGPALVLDTIGRNVRIENLVIRGSAGREIVLTRGVDLSCVDCDYNDQSTSVFGGSELRRYARLNIATVDTAESPISGLSVSVVGADGTEAFVGLTDDEGLVPTLELLLSTNDGAALTKHGPYYVTVRTDQMTLRDTVDAIGYTELIYELPSGVTAVEEEIGVAGSAVIPHPARAGEAVELRIPGITTERITVRLYDTEGREEARLLGSSVDGEGTFRLTLPHDIASGAYVLLIDRGNGRTRAMRVVVR